MLRAEVLLYLLVIVPENVRQIKMLSGMLILRQHLLNSTCSNVSGLLYVA